MDSNENRQNGSTCLDSVVPPEILVPSVVEGVHQVILKIDEGDIRAIRPKIRDLDKASDVELSARWIDASARLLWDTKAAKHAKRFPRLYQKEAKIEEMILDGNSIIETASKLGLIPDEEKARLIEAEPFFHGDSKWITQAHSKIAASFFQLLLIDYHRHFLEAAIYFKTLTATEASEIEKKLLSPRDFEKVTYESIQKLFETISPSGAPDTRKVYPRTLREIEGITISVNREFIKVFSLEKIKESLYELAQRNKFLPPGFDSVSLDSVRWVDLDTIRRQLKPEILIEGLLSITTYIGPIGLGNIVKTHSLFPGEKAIVSIETYKKEASTYSLTSSVLDSSSLEAEDSLNKEINFASQKDDEVSRSSSFSIGGEGKAKWGSGSASVSANHSSNTQSSTKRTVSNAAKALSSQASKVSRNRTVKVDTSSTGSMEEGSRQSVVRTIENINVSSPLNFVFRQMNHETLSLISIKDIRITIRTDALDRGVVCLLEEAPDVLKERMFQDTSKLRKYYDRILSAVKSMQYRDLANSGRPWTVEASDIGDSEIPRFRINPDLAGVLDAYATGPNAPSEDIKTLLRKLNFRELRYSGILLQLEQSTLKSEGIYVDCYLSNGCGLDKYSQILQVEAGRAKTLVNDAAASRIAAISAANMIIEAVGTPEEKAGLFERLLVPLLKTANHDRSDS